MAEPDQFASRFRELAAASIAATSAPGIPALLGRVRRRRARRTAALVATIVLAVVPLVRYGSFATVPQPLATATPGLSESPTAGPAPTATPATALTPAPAPTSQPLARSSVSSSPRPRVVTSPPGPKKCVPDVYLSGSEIGVHDDLMWQSATCANARVNVFWVTYRTAADGTRVKYRSVSYRLDHANRTVTISPLRPPENCGYSIHVVRGEIAVPGTLPSAVTAGSASAFWSSRGANLVSAGFSSGCPSPEPS